jgi:uncharacterized protein YeaO (DUF488 family)
MPIRIIQLGSSRHPGEGTRIGAVRRPPRGVRKDRYAAENWYDVWLPELAPSEELVAKARGAASEKEWATIMRAYRSEMKAPSASRVLDLLAALSNEGNFSVGCYCESEARCHRSVLRELLREHGARLVEP